MKITFKTIERLQKEYQFDSMQKLINSGLCWHMEGSVGREAGSLLECGACMLPKRSVRDYYGNIIPSRDELKEGTKGTYHNSVDFWAKVINGEIIL